MKTALLLSLLILSTNHSQGQIYFDELYGATVNSGEGISTNGTIAVEGGYLSWSYVYGKEQPLLFTVDLQGVLIDSISIDRPDTAALWGRNVLQVNDTLFVGCVWRQVYSEPQDQKGDIGLIFFDNEGNVDSESYYGQVGRMEYPARVSRTSDLGYVVAGALGVQSGNDIQHNAYLVKLNSAGQMVWENSFGGAQFDEGRSVIETPDGGFLLLGWTRSFGAGQKDWYLVKTDFQGNEQWSETYGDSNNQSASSIVKGPNESYILVGGGGQQNARVIRIDAEGSVIWQETYAHPEGSGGNYLFDCLVRADSTIVAVGGSNNSGEGDAGWLLKTDSQGNLLWQRKYNKNSQTDLFYSVLQTEDDGFLLSGQAINEQTNSQDAWLLKVDSVGCPYPNCTVGIDEEEKTILVDVWPNPATDVLNIEKQDFSAALEMTVFDINGREILKQVQNDAREQIDVTSWPASVYVLQGTDEEGRSFSVKVVKQ